MNMQIEKNKGDTETAWCFDYLYTEPEPEPEADEAAVVPVLLLSSDAGFVNHARRDLVRAGFTVVAASSRSTAYQLVGQLRFDALIIDYDLPENDGIEFYSDIRALLGDLAPPALVLTEQCSGGPAAHCRRNGLANLHAKGDGADRLINMLSQLVEDRDKRRAIKETIVAREQDWYVDALTGLPSECYFSWRLLGESTTAADEGTQVSLLMITPDQFERISDRFGRRTADSVLREVGSTIRGELRTRDCVARYGDHTFAVILPCTGLSGATAVASRLQQVLARTEFGTLEGPLGVSFSIGVAGADAGPALPAEVLCSRALRACAGVRSMGGGRVLADESLTGAPVVLLVSPGVADADLVAELATCAVEVRAVESLAEAWDAVRFLPVSAIIVSTTSLEGEEAVELLARTRSRRPRVKRVLAAPHVDRQLGVSAINRAGIEYFLPLPASCVQVASMIDSLVHR